MGASLCGNDGSEYMCNNRHIMKYISIAESPEDFLNARNTIEKRICVECNKGVQECQAQVCWACEECKFYYCAKCKGYLVDKCPANHKLKNKTLEAKDDAFCDICTTPIVGQALNCNQCRFNLCKSCQGVGSNVSKKGKKK